MSLRRDGTARRRAPPQDLVDRLLARERSAPRAHRGRAAPAGSAEGKAEEGTARPGRRPGRGDDLRRAGQGRRLHGGGPPRHHTERSKWRHTFRRLAADALAALAASDPAPAQQAVAKIVDLACDMKRYDYFHSDDPVEAAKFVVPEAVAALWESVLRHGGFAALAARAPEQLIRWEADYGWTRRGYGQVAERETPLAVPLAAAYDAGYVADVRRGLPGGAGGGRARGSQAAGHRVRNLRRAQLPAQGAGRRPRRVARDAPRPVRGDSRGRIAGPARRQPGAGRTGAHLPAREDRAEEHTS